MIITDMQLLGGRYNGEKSQHYSDSPRRDRGMNQKELAARMGMSEKHISKLINGEVQLTMDTARRLEMVLGLPAQFWCNLETIYREKIAMVNEENAMDEDIEIAKKMPYKEMARNGWVEDITKWSERVIRLRKYFEVAQLGFLQGNKRLCDACLGTEGENRGEKDIDRTDRYSDTDRKSAADKENDSDGPGVFLPTIKGRTCRLRRRHRFSSAYRRIVFARGNIFRWK